MICFSCEWTMKWQCTVKITQVSLLTTDDHETADWSAVDDEFV